MFVPGRVLAALEEKRESFRRAAERAGELQERYLRAFDDLAGLSGDDLRSLIGGVQWPGARPAEDFRGGPVIPFPERWATVQEARGWALEQLRGTTTVAVDGSQVAASKEFAVPISLAQVAWFENYHDPDRPYVKDVVNEAVTVDDEGDEIQEYMFAESRLNQRRFALEMAVAAGRIGALPADPLPLVFIDGSLVLSFIGRVMEPARQSYLDALFRLLDASEENRVPVIGYVDLSFASDLVAMLRTAFDLPQGPLHDAHLLAERLGPLDRTVAFQCARGDVLPLYKRGERDRSEDLCFVYLKAGQERPAARIDFPRWILEAGHLDRVIDIIRAEIVVGSGYPYALETADAAAVLSLEDRLAFYRLFHEFAQSSGLEAPLPTKSVSKAHRRA